MGGLNRLRDGKVVASFTERNGLSGPEVRALSVDTQGVLWAGSNRGLDRFDGSAFGMCRVTLAGLWH